MKTTALLVALSLAACSGREVCERKVATMKKRLASSTSVHKPDDLPVSFASDGAGRTTGAVRVKLVDDGTRVRIDDGGAQALILPDIEAAVKSHGTKIIEVDVPGNATKFHDTLALLTEIGELHVMVALVSWPRDHHSKIVEELEPKVKKTDRSQAFYLMGDATRALLGESCEAKVNEVAGELQGLPREQQDAAIRERFPAALRQCKCDETDVDGFGALLEVELMPRFEVGWFRVVRGSYGLPRPKTMADFVDQLALIPADTRAGGFTF